MEKDNKEKGVDTTVYEMSYLLLPSLASEQVPAKATELKDMVTSAGGAVISFEEPILIDLAYPMLKVTLTSRQKVDSGYFGWIKFEIGSENVEIIKKNLDTNADVVRYLIVKTVRENTLLGGKMNIQKEERMKKEEDALVEVSEEVKDTSIEEMDKSIDDLVIA